MRPYEPDFLPLDGLDCKRLLPLIGPTTAALARYVALLEAIPNPALLLSPLTIEEAVLSSQIEGTQATLDEVLEHEAGILKEGEKAKDIQEILNYRAALHAAHDHLRDRPLTLAVVRELHKILLNSVRGHDKSPGEFRKDQNWIGPYGSTIENATFVPPNPFQLQDHLEKWQAYIQSDDIDVLIQTAAMHAQFELLHPFKDGNGRIGRILIPLFLYQKQVLGFRHEVFYRHSRVLVGNPSEIIACWRRGRMDSHLRGNDEMGSVKQGLWVSNFPAKALSHPMFYLSEYLESHRNEYYQRLKAISADGDWHGWIMFFLRAVAKQATDNFQKTKRTLSLYDEMKTKIPEITHSQYGIRIIDFLFRRPIFRTTQFTEETEIHKPTAAGLLRILKQNQLLTELRPGAGRTAAVLCFPALINIAEGKKVF